MERQRLAFAEPAKRRRRCDIDLFAILREGVEARAGSLIVHGLHRDIDMVILAGRLGATAQDAEDRILYDQTLGELWYDSDGVGGAQVVQQADQGDYWLITVRDTAAVSPGTPARFLNLQVIVTQ